jgi:hypothetical protein
MIGILRVNQEICLLEPAAFDSCFLAGWEPIAYDPVAAPHSDEQDLRLGKGAKDWSEFSLSNAYHVIEKIGN